MQVPVLTKKEFIEAFSFSRLFSINPPAVPYKIEISRKTKINTLSFVIESTRQLFNAINKISIAKNEGMLPMTAASGISGIIKGLVLFDIANT